MDIRIVPFLSCPNCHSTPLEREVFEFRDEQTIENGVLICKHCRAWYPIEAGLLELLPDELAYPQDRQAFWAKYQPRLSALGLSPHELPPQALNEGSLQRKQQEHFDWYADNPDQSYSEYERMPFWQAADRIAFSGWKKEIKDGAWLLDVGCAQGRSTFWFMDHDIQIVAFDISKKLVRQAIDRYRSGSHQARATFFVTDATHFPFVDHTFDYALVYGVLHHLPDPPQACREIARLLKPGGVYFGEENNASLFRGIFDWIQRLSPIWHEEAGAEALITADKIREWFRETQVEIETSTSVFLPPHLVNLFSHKAAYRLVDSFDKIGGSMPILRNNGGILLVRGSKSRS